MPIPVPSYSSEPPNYAEAQQAALQSPSDHFFSNDGQPPLKKNFNQPPNAPLPVTSSYNISTACTPSLDMSCVKQEPGFQSNFPSDPNRRTVSMDGPYPFHIKTEINQSLFGTNDVVRRQMSMPLNSGLHSPIALEARRSSEPAITPWNTFPRSQPYPMPGTPSGPPPFSRPPSQLAFPHHSLDNQQRQDLYYVNLASYHHHQEMETRKRRELTKGKLRLN